ncbi:unnamed protein product [Cuscuta epithymum]|uniref:Myb/SANT-like domain-containing protein n=1 Tax=Cuscuta epithymum TaxID=186058 RepID=A0AAV0GI74_9ASTE|nr:unnamed protein product [Cuscuta epithymum]
MGDSQGKTKIRYSSWSVQESSLLLQLLVDGAIRGWRDSSGLISKQMVEKQILPVLNARLQCEKTYLMYQSRWKYFKQKYQKYEELMRFSPGFGWDSTNKRFTASEEVWKNYFESHPKHKNFRTDTILDYEDLQIVVGNAMATGRYSIGLGEKSDARTYGGEENTHPSLEDYVVDESEDVLMSYQQAHSNDNVNEESLNQPPQNAGHSSRQSRSKKRSRSESDRACKQNDSVSRGELQTKIASSMDSISEIASDIRGVKVLMEKREKDRERNEKDKKETENNNIWNAITKIASGMDSISEIASDIRGMRVLMEKREKDRERNEKEKKEAENNNIWNAIKETPNLDDRIRYQALTFIHKFGMKEAFLTMSLHERSEWIHYNVE